MLNQTGFVLAASNMTGRRHLPDMQYQPEQQHAFPQSGACVAAAAVPVCHHFRLLHPPTVLQRGRNGHLLPKQLFEQRQIDPCILYPPLSPACGPQLPDCKQHMSFQLSVWHFTGCRNLWLLLVTRLIVWCLME